MPAVVDATTTEAIEAYRTASAGRPLREKLVRGDEPATLPDAAVTRLAVFVISVAAELTGLHPQTLRTYERMGLITPGRTGGGGRRYSPRDIDLLREIARADRRRHRHRGRPPHPRARERGRRSRARVASAEPTSPSCRRRRQPPATPDPLGHHYVRSRRAPASLTPDGSGVVLSTGDAQSGEQVLVQLDPHGVARVDFGGVNPESLSAVHAAAGRRHTGLRSRRNGPGRTR